jgi:hypothetical protein
MVEGFVPVYFQKPCAKRLLDLESRNRIRQQNNDPWSLDRNLSKEELEVDLETVLFQYLCGSLTKLVKGRGRGGFEQLHSVGAPLEWTMTAEITLRGICHQAKTHEYGPRESVQLGWMGCRQTLFALLVVLRLSSVVVDVLCVDGCDVMDIHMDKSLDTFFF